MLDQAAAYPFMKPIFGEGVVFDAPPEERRRDARSTALRGARWSGMPRSSPPSPTAVADWADEGEIDLLDCFAELTIYTSSRA